jgi:tRNA threonylcarbamoyladenosine biosynthesis protein TsaE
MIYKSNSPEETEKIAAEFALTLKKNAVIAMTGGLGAGKTCFVRGLCTGLGIDETEVTSPTFTIVNEYRGISVLYHFDMYRVTNDADLETTGFFDYTDGFKIIEWSENIKEFLPADVCTVDIAIISENEREIVINC